MIRGPAAYARPGGRGRRIALDVIAIGTREAPTEIRGQLTSALEPLRGRGTPLDLDLVARGELTFVRCRLGDGASRADAVELRHTVAAVLSGWIVERSEPERLQRLIRMRYEYLTPAERARVLEHARRQLAPAARREGVGRRQRILQRLNEYLERSDTLVIDGFCTFRLKEQQEELAEVVERAADGVLLEREYEEFVLLLRHVVETHPAPAEELHCRFEAPGGLRLEDAGGRDVGRPCLADLAAEAAAHGVGAEDLLVSALITLAPRRLWLHLPGERRGLLSGDTVGILRAVFGGRLEVCGGCPRCRSGPG